MDGSGAPPSPDAKRRKVDAAYAPDGGTDGIFSDSESGKSATSDESGGFEGDLLALMQGGAAEAKGDVPSAPPVGDGGGGSRTTSPAAGGAAPQDEPAAGGAPEGAAGGDKADDAGRPTVEWPADIQPAPKITLIAAWFHLGVEVDTARLCEWVWNAVYHNAQRRLDVVDRHGNSYRVFPSGTVTVATTGFLVRTDRELRKASRAFARMVQRALERDRELADETMFVTLPDPASVKFLGYRVTNVWANWRPLNQHSIDIEKALELLRAPRVTKWAHTMRGQDGTSLRVTLRDPMPDMVIEIKPNGLVTLFGAKDQDSINLVGPILYNEAALEVLQSELDRERRTSEGYRHRLVTLSEEVGRRRSRIEHLEGQLAHTHPDTADTHHERLREELQHKDVLVAKLQRQVDEDQTVIASLRSTSASSTVKAASNGPRMSPLAPRGRREKSGEPPLPTPVESRHTTPPRSHSVQRRAAVLENELDRACKRVTDLEHQLGVQKAASEKALADAAASERALADTTALFEQEVAAVQGAAAESERRVAAVGEEAAELRRRCRRLEAEAGSRGQVVAEEGEGRTHTRNMSRKLLEYYKEQMDELQAQLDASELRRAELEEVHRGTVRREDHKKVDDLQRQLKRERGRWGDEREALMRASDDQAREIQRLRDLVAQDEPAGAGGTQVAYDSLRMEYEADRAEWVADRKRLLSLITNRTSPERSPPLSVGAASPPAVSPRSETNALAAARTEIRRLRGENNDLALELETLTREMADKRRMVEVVAQKAAQFAGTKKLLQTQFDTDRAEIMRLNDHMQQLEEENERLGLEAEVERTARRTSAQLAAVFSMKITDFLNTIRASAAQGAGSLHVAIPVSLLNTQAAMFAQLSSHCEQMMGSTHTSPPRVDRYLT